MTTKHKHTVLCIEDKITICKCLDKGARLFMNTVVISKSTISVHIFISHHLPDIVQKFFGE